MPTYEVATTSPAGGRVEVVLNITASHLHLIGGTYVFSRGPAASSEVVAMFPIHLVQSIIDVDELG
jgi:hypothetical protein